MKQKYILCRKDALNPQGFDGGSEEKRSGSGPLHHSAYQKEL
jgi:hypothetical protein